MKIDYQSLFGKLKRGEIAPLYLFIGTEEYLINEIISLIKKRIIVKGEEELNFDLLYGDETDARTIIERVRTPSFLGNKRLVVVRGVDSLKEKEIKEIISYVKDADISNCLILVGSQINANSKLYTLISQLKHAETVNIWPLFPNQIPGWIQGKIRDKGKKISYECVKEFQELADGSLADLAQEIEKLVTYVGKKEKIEEDDVREVISSGYIGNVFKLTDAIGEKRLDKALKIFYQLKNSGEDLIGILNLILRHFRILWNVKELDEEGIEPLEISQIVKIKPLFLKNYLQQIKNFSRDDLKNIFKRILQTDWQIKTGFNPPEAAIELFLISLVK